MAMAKRDHILNVLKEVFKGQPNPGENSRDYLERMADLALGFIEEDKGKKSGKKEDQA